MCKLVRGEGICGRRQDAGIHGEEQCEYDREWLCEAAGRVRLLVPTGMAGRSSGGNVAGSSAVHYDRILPDPTG